MLTATTEKVVRHGHGASCLLTLLTLSLGGFDVGCRARKDDRLAHPLPASNEVTVGRLANGLSYWIAPQSGERRAGTSLWLRVVGGTLAESDAERGAAHLLEHVLLSECAGAFPWVRPGENLNATTTARATTYQLTLTGGSADLEQGLALLSQLTRGATLRGASVEHEARITEAERRDREQADGDPQDDLLAHLYPDSALARGGHAGASPPGTDALAGYYQRQYRPELATLLVAGDLGGRDVRTTAGLITRSFSSWQPAGRPLPPAPQLHPSSDRSAAVVFDAAPDTAEITVATAREQRPLVTQGDLRDRLTHLVAAAIVNRRLTDSVAASDGPFRAASARVSSFHDLATHNVGRATCGPADWPRAVTALVGELRRACELGFTREEVEEAKHESLSSAAQATRRDASLDPQSYASRLNIKLAMSVPPLSEPQILELRQQWLPTITPAELQAAVCTDFPKGHWLTMLRLPSAIAGAARPTPVEVERVVEAAEKGVVAPRPETPQTDAIPRLAGAGQVARRAREKDTGALFAVMENGVRVRVRRLTTVPGTFRGVASIHTGSIGETPLEIARGRLAAAVFATVQTRDTAPGQLARALARRRVLLSYEVRPDGIDVHFTGPSEHLSDLLAVLALVLDQGQLDERAQKLEARRQHESRSQPGRTLEAALAARVRRALTVPGGPEGLDPAAPADPRRVLEEGGHWFDVRIRRAPLDVALVGDLDEVDAVAVVARTIGGLPPRSARQERSDRPRTVNLGPVVVHDTSDVASARVAVEVGWCGAAVSSLRDQRWLTLAADTLTARLNDELRVRRGWVYGARAVFAPGSRGQTTAMSHLSAGFSIAPADLSSAMAVARQTLDQFAAAGPTPAEVSTALADFERDRARHAGDPGWWLERLAQANEETSASSQADGAEQPLRASAADVRAAVRRYIASAHRLEVTVGQAPSSREAARSSTPAVSLVGAAP